MSIDNDIMWLVAMLIGPVSLDPVVVLYIMGTVAKKLLTVWKHRSQEEVERG